MDLHRLEVFCKLVDTGSFSLTARELGLTQPTVSGHIKTLEQMIGLRLFDRHKRKVRPTNAAMVLYDYAQRMLELRREAGYALEQFRGRITGRLALGGSTIPGTYILPAIIGRFRRIHDETYLSLTMGDTSNITEAVRAGRLEIGVVGAASNDDTLKFDPLIDDELVLAVPNRPNWPGWKEPANALTMARLKKVPFIIRQPGSGTRKSMEDALKKKGVSTNDLSIVAEMGNTEAVRQGIKSGMGASILSRVAVAEDVEAGRVSIYKIQGLDLSRRFFVVNSRHHTESPLCVAFREFLRDQCHGGALPAGW